MMRWNFHKEKATRDTIDAKENIEQIFPVRFPPPPTKSTTVS